MADLFAPTVARTANAYAAAGKTYKSSDATNNTDGVKNNAGYLQSSSSDNLALTMEQFLQLMIVQFQNQDMDNPASTSDMMNQLMQMSTIQAMATMTDASTMSYAASLVGKTVTVGEYTKNGLNEIVGVVTGTGTYNGEQVIFVNGKSYKLNSIMAVGEIPKEDDSEKPEDGKDDVDPGFSRPTDVDPDFSKPPAENGSSTGDSQTGSDTAGGTDNKTESGEG